MEGTFGRGQGEEWAMTDWSYEGTGTGGSDLGVSST